MASYLITGTSRGLGLAIATNLAARPASEVSIVFTAARSQSDALRKLDTKYPGRIEFVKMEVTSQDDIEQAVSQVEQKLDGKGLDILINNAGIMPTTPGGIQNMADLDEVLHVNVVGVHYVTSGFLPLLEKGTMKRVVNMSSTVGSIATVQYFKQLKTPAYKVSKAGLNMLTKEYSVNYADQGFTFVAISPGWVRTDLGSQYADLEIDEAIPPIFELLDNLKTEDNGRFLDIHIPNFKNAHGIELYKGGDAPW